MYKQQISNSYIMANERLGNITAPSPRVKLEVEGSLYSIIPRLRWYNYFVP